MNLEIDLTRLFASQARGCEREVDLALFTCGELPAERAAELQRHAAQCDECRDTLADLRRTEAIWASVPAQPMADVIAFPRRVRIVVAAVAALAAALAVWVAARPHAAAEDDGLRPMGTWSLEVGVLRGGRSFLAVDGSQLEKGDQLGLFFTSAKSGHLTVLYADGHGAPTRLFPARERSSAFVQAGNRVALRDGAVISDGTDCEWVVGFFTERPLSAAKADELARGMVARRKGCTLGTPQGPVDAHVVTVKR